MKKQFTSTSFLALLFSCLFIISYRISNVSDKETSWDVLGYYMPLPATFIYEDPLLEEPSWIREINDEKQLTGTLYQISSNDEGEPIYFFLFGMAILYLPFFLMGHGGAYLFDFLQDGFSLPYQYAMVIGAIVYTVLGLIYLRKILLRYFPERVTALLILVTVFATNYSHHLTLKNLETVNVLFLFVTLIIWNTIKWHETHKLKNLIFIGAFITLMSMVKPSEILIVFIPLLWGVFSKKSAKEKIKLILKYRHQFFIAISVCLVIAFPQILYWYTRTGHFFYDSYKNPGVGLDVLSPHIWPSLFGYKKGWLVYTPVMILSLIGFYFMIKHFKKERLALLFYFFISFYIIVSWSEWWYGAGFSNRPLITAYPILLLGMGSFFMMLQNRSKLLKVVTSIFITGCLFLNQFQWWQLKNGILEPYRTTKEYYWATFLKTSANEDDKKLLSIFRGFNGTHNFINKEEYKIVSEHFVDFEIDGNDLYKFNAKKEFSPSFEKEFREITSKDHIWVQIDLVIRNDKVDREKLPLLVTHMDRKEGAYGYYTAQIPSSFNGNTEFPKDFLKFTSYYLTPSIRSFKDRLKIYIWNQGRMEAEIGYLKITIFEKKN